MQGTITYHFIKNINSPLASVAPSILSGSKWRSNPLGRLSSSIFFRLLLFVSPSIERRFLRSLRLLFSYAAIRSGQSKFSSGSQVLSSLKANIYFVNSIRKYFAWEVFR